MYQAQATPPTPERAPGPLTHPPHSGLPKLGIHPTGTVLGSETFRPDFYRTEARKFALTVARPLHGPAVCSGSFLPLGLKSHRGTEWGHRSKSSRDKESFWFPFRGSPSDEDTWEGGRGARQEFG